MRAALDLIDTVYKSGVIHVQCMLCVHVHIHVHSQTANAQQNLTCSSSQVLGLQRAVTRQGLIVLVLQDYATRVFITKQPTRKWPSYSSLESQLAYTMPF